MESSTFHIRHPLSSPMSPFGLDGGSFGAGGGTEAPGLARTEWGH